jgi:hypothetical protein
MRAALAKKILPNPFIHDGTPGILVAADISRSASREVGYFIALSQSATPRLLYRHIGSVLQKVRRFERLQKDERMRTNFATSGVAGSRSGAASQKSSQAED